MENSPFEINENSEKRYFQGRLNFLFRLYYFIQEGMGQATNLKNVALLLSPYAAYLGFSGDAGGLLKVALLGLALMPVFAFAGWIWVMRGRKSTDYFVWKYASPVSRYNAQMSEKQIEQNSKIIESLNKILEQLKING